MALQTFKSDDKDFMLMQSAWSAQLNPVLGNPMTNPLILKNISLVTGPNIINHRLGTSPVGWFISDITSAATIYRSQPFNNLTLTLVASAPCVISLGVF